MKFNKVLNYHLTIKKLLQQSNQGFVQFIANTTVIQY